MSGVLGKLCATLGIETEYTDVWGQRHAVSLDTQRALLAEMGISADSASEVKEALAVSAFRSWQRLLPPVRVFRQSQGPLKVPVTVPAVRSEEPLRWTLKEEHGVQRTGTCRASELEVLRQAKARGGRFLRAALLLPHPSSLGYHRLEIESLEDGPSAHMVLIVAPHRCYQPAALQGTQRAWGPALQLYAVRSQRNWGIGDFTDLRNLIELSRDIGADVVGLNPLHALFQHDPRHASPYSPSSRLFLNPLYLDIEAIPDFSECTPARATVEDSVFQERLRALRATEHVGYDAVWGLKRTVLEKLYQHFRAHHIDRSTGRAKAFAGYRSDRGSGLRMHALFEALQDHLYRQHPSAWGWLNWPAAYRDPRSTAVVKFAAHSGERIEFFEYLQWQADLQLAAAGRRSLALGLGIGIYQDLALGVDPGGSDSWTNQALYALQVRIGVPPDDFSLKGQDWGLPPLIPAYLKEVAYDPFIATLRANMRHAGALRIDHIMGLMRLFWIPPGLDPSEGAYVRYPFGDLLSILALESQRNQCLVIGEDLGTVPDEVRQQMRSTNVLSCRVLYFEKTQEGSFMPPMEYPSNALVEVTTHDLPTLAGFWRGRDLDLRTKLQLFPTETIREGQIIGRAQDRTRLLAALKYEGLLPAGMGLDPASVSEMSLDLCCAIHRYLARSAAKIMMINVDDIFGLVEQANLPGTVDQHLNWLYKLPVSLEEWAHDPRVQVLTAAIRMSRING